MRWRRPPPLCDCTRPTTRLERLVWWLRARLQRLLYGRKKVEFKYLVTPTYTKSGGVELSLREVLTENSVKDDRP